MKLNEHEITRQIRDMLKALGIWHFKHWGGPMSQPGIPDIIGIHKGRPFFIEVKTEKGRLSEHQQRMIDVINDNDGIAFVARSPDDVIEKLGLNIGPLFNGKGRRK